MSMWNKIEDLKPEKDKAIIGLWLHGNLYKVLDGVLYDLRPNCVIDFGTGKWMEITHWTYVPEDN